MEEERSWPVFDPGDQLELYHQVESGNPLVPTTPVTYSVTVKLPDGTEQTPTIEEAAEGDLRALFIAEQEGWYWYRWETDNPRTVAQGVFEVKSLETHLSP